MSADIVIERYSGQSPDRIFAMLLPIQQVEFGLPVGRHSQPDVENIAAYYQKGVGDFWLALAGDEIVGTIALQDIGDRQAALRKMFVHADFRGREHGVSGRLLGVALTAAQQNGVTDIFLGTTEFFRAAHRFYEKNGFAEIGKQELPPAFQIMAVDTKFYRLRLA